MAVSPSPLVFVPLSIGQKIADRFRSTLSKILAFFPSLKYDLRALGISEVKAYTASNIISSFLLAIMFGLAILLALKMAKAEARMQSIAALASLAVFLTVFVFNMIYPGIKTRTFAVRIDRDLIFALKDMLIQVESGIPLYEAMVNIANSSYGIVSSDFKGAVKEMSAGTPESAALQKIALSTKSEFFKKALWQLISSLEKGARLGPALKSVVETLENYQYKSIRDYSSTLNFIVLVYMLTSAAVPSLGITFSIVLSAFGGLGVNEQMLTALISVSLLAQVILIGYVSSARPLVYE